MSCKDKNVNKNARIQSSKCLKLAMSARFKVRLSVNFDVSISCIYVILIGSSLGQVAEQQEQEGLPDVASDQPGNVVKSQIFWPSFKNV